MVKTINTSLPLLVFHCKTLLLTILESKACTTDFYKKKSLHPRASKYMHIFLWRKRIENDVI